MYYGKLPIVFLSTLASNQDNSTNCYIATYILTHLDEVKHYSIKELAENCFVSTSSLSRFCRDVGLENFLELKTLLAQTEYKFEMYSRKPLAQDRTNEYIKRVENSIENLKNSLDPKKIERLAQDIKKFERVAVFGLLKAETVAMNLQGDLLLLGKVTTTKVEFRQQMQYLEQATEKDLIIIFSYTGIYFDYCFPSGVIPASIAKPKIYFITSDQNAKKNKYLDEIIYFKSNQDQASHPYQLQIIGGLISQHYAYVTGLRYTV